MTPTSIPEGTDPIVAVLEAGGTLTAIMEDLGKYRVENPIDDITSALVNAEIEDEKLTQQELASFFVLLVTAGNETTRTAIAHGLYALTEHPQQKALLVDDFETHAKTATDEIVRWASPVIWMRRTLATDYVLSARNSSRATSCSSFTTPPIVMRTSSTIPTDSTSRARPTTTTDSALPDRTSASVPTSPAARSR